MWKPILLILACNACRVTTSTVVDSSAILKNDRLETDTAESPLPHSMRHNMRLRRENSNLKRPPVGVDWNWRIQRRYREEQLLYLVYWNTNTKVVIYFDKETVGPKSAWNVIYYPYHWTYDGNATWMFEFTSKVWEFTTRTYGKIGLDPYLYLVVQKATTRRNEALTFSSLDPNNFNGQRNILDLNSQRPEAWLSPSRRNEEMNLIAQSIGNFVEGSSKDRLGSPSLHVWWGPSYGVTAWVDIFTWDVYTSLNITAHALHYLTKAKTKVESSPTEITFWFRDWFHPIYKDYGGSSVLNEYFELLSKNIPFQKDFYYTFALDMGSFVHFWSAAAGQDLRNLALVAFGWNSTYEEQFLMARRRFVGLNELYMHNGKINRKTETTKLIILETTKPGIMHYEPTTSTAEGQGTSGVNTAMVYTQSSGITQFASSTTTPARHLPAYQDELSNVKSQTGGENSTSKSFSLETETTETEFFQDSAKGDDTTEEFKYDKSGYENGNRKVITILSEVEGRLIGKIPPPPTLDVIATTITNPQNSGQSLITEHVLANDSPSRDATLKPTAVVLQIQHDPSTVLKKSAVMIGGGVGAVIILILLVGLIASFIFYKRKIQNLQTEIRSLTNDEVKDFFEGSSNFNPDEAQALVLSMPFIQDFEIPRERMILDSTKVLGSGQFGTVIHGLIRPLENNQNQQLMPIAIKTVNPNVDVVSFKAFLSEVKIMAYLGKHEHIVELVGTCTANIKNREILIALEYCTLGNLLDYLRQNKNNFSKLRTYITATGTRTRSEAVAIDLLVELPANSNPGPLDSLTTPPNNVKEITTLDLLKWSQQISNAMIYLTQKKVIHGDLAARNILLTANCVVKISDFGLSRQFLNYANYMKTSKTPVPWRWLSVEALKQMKFSIASDVWAFGVTMWEIFSLGEIPYGAWTYDLFFVDKLLGGERLLSPAFTDPDVYDLMKDCWKVEPTERPTFDRIHMILGSLISKQVEAMDKNVGDKEHIIKQE